VRLFPSHTEPERAVVAGEDVRNSVPGHTDRDVDAGWRGKQSSAVDFTFPARGEEGERGGEKDPVFAADGSSMFAPSDDCSTRQLFRARAWCMEPFHGLLSILRFGRRVDPIMMTVQ
jgi:hypothetical protein